MADITVTKTPNEYELASGKVIVSLYDLDSTPNTRMVLKVKDVNDDVIGDLRQIPNSSGYAHFDIGKMLRSQVSSKPNLESIPQLSNGDYEILQYYFEYGYAPFDGDFVSEGFSGILYAINGRKAYNIIDWDYEPYIPEISLQTVGAFTINVTNSYQKALTDRVFTTTTGANVTNKPSWVTAAVPVSIGDIRRGNDYTLSFINDWIPDPTVGNWTNGINAFRIAIYDGATQLADTQINNVTGSGGGPSVIYGDEIDPTDEFRLITTQAGNANNIIAAYPQATHYYVGAATFTQDPDTSTALTLVSHAYRFNVVDGECNDFDNIQVSLVNSLWGRDYFDFQKRNDKSVSVTRNTYRQLDADWSAPQLTVNSYNRGERVFSQSVQTNYTANTRYLTDEESKFLENLYISPDVRVKIGGNAWEPVILTSNEFTEKTFRKDQMFQHTISFRLANPIQTQIG